ncbi:MAG TPA: hypothetical protein VNZ64_07070 [Candidatus Acidoferrum sp.]|nr:hypothetical protein [Candidatus Acidoferrum sp.]
MTSNCATFTAQDGQTYGFYSAGHDAAGNVEPAHSAADTTTTEVLGSVRLTARLAALRLTSPGPLRSDICRQ